MERKPVFDVIREERERGFTDTEVVAVDELLDTLGFPKESTGRKVSEDGIALLHKWEGCELTAYPDPGSADGNPWTIGWGSTGEGIKKGVTWTQQQADDRFEKDIQKYADQVSSFIGGVPTSQPQFDALVSFHYNTGAIASSTLGKKHKAADYSGAANEFKKWNKNDGKVMQGLTNRRADEEALYRSGM